ncbi:MAG: right-handed parallel beta-helix repeat-containing protein [bacterium]|nr:right-handed parallel beta-helix repeat-containing protein [bacterium]MDT8365954.1 right-handed parallel beta-helix repeat-containing protein [bacterium]
MKHNLVYGLMLLVIAAGVIPGRGIAGEETPIQQVIRQKETWRKEVKVDGIVIVAKGGILNIAPGTRVVFSVRDDDGDGIGDSELRVEGSLEVTGTEKVPVIFTSAAAEPGPADWKYIMINHADSASVSNAVVEYAYSGIQVHYTRGSFSGLVSRHNVDGFRFSTAPVTLENSLLTKNVNGIRFEERGAGAVIRNNDITRNRIGVFAVIKCEGLTTFGNNSIAGNSDYAVKMGMEQRDDIPMKGNWWGGADPEQIREFFFDGKFEPGLGRVLFEPFLTDRPNMVQTP